MTRQVDVAVGPDGGPSWFADVADEAGARIVDVERAEALFWFHVDPAPVAQLIERCPGLRWIQLHSSGVDRFGPLIDDAHLWTCAKGMYARSVSEHTLALILAGNRLIHHYARAVRWEEKGGTPLYGANVLIVGGGGIAEQLIRLLAPFEVTATVVRRTPGTAEGAAVLTPDRLTEALPTADVIVLALPLTAETRHLISGPQLALMKSDAWLVNVSRGPVVDTEALTVALREGRIRGAALDVTEPEPLPEGHPLWSEPRCLITPHTANPPDMMVPQLREVTIRNLVAYRDGSPLQGIIDPVHRY